MSAPPPPEICPSCHAPSKALSRFEKKCFSIIFKKEDPPFLVEDLSGYCCTQCHEAYLDEECDGRFQDAHRWVEVFYRQQQYHDLQQGLVLDCEDMVNW